MSERFTERSRRAVALAQEEARELGHNYLGTEHLLLGLLREDEGLAARVLDTQDVTLEEARAQVARIVGRGASPVSGAMPFTPRARTVLELALQESRSLGQTYIGTEHILLGLVCENQGVGARILDDLGADAESIRDEILKMLAGPSRPRAGTAIRQVVIACPACGYRLETVVSDRPGATLQVSAEGERTCAGCGARWTISYEVTWREPSG